MVANSFFKEDNVCLVGKCIVKNLAYYTNNVKMNLLLIVMIIVSSTKYNLIFEEIFKIKVTDENKSRLVYKKYSQWDSLAQMTLIQSIEETFRIMIPFDEMMCIDSYEHGLDYLTDKLK